MVKKIHNFKFPHLDMLFEKFFFLVLSRTDLIPKETQRLPLDTSNLVDLVFMKSTHKNCNRL